MFNKISISKKEVLPYIIVGVILEIALISLLHGSGANLTLLLGVVAIPLALSFIYIMFLSLEKSILITMFAIPLIPLSGYVMLRLNMLDYQFVIYIIFYVVSAVAMIKNGVIGRIDKNNIKFKTKYIRILMGVLLVINIIFAYNKQLSFMIITLSFLPFGIYSYIIKGLDVKPREGFMDKVIFAISLGCTISSLPDFIFFIINWIGGQRGVRSFGPLTGNYILMYDLIIFVVVLNKWVKEANLKNKWTLLVISLLIVISTQISRGALITFIAIMASYLIFDIRNWKKYLPIFLIGACFLSYNVMSRPDVANDSNIAEIKDIIDSKQDDMLDDASSPMGKIILNILNSQSQTRQAIWKATINITADYPTTGIGIGNLQYFFDSYTTGKKGYTDAHNLFLNISCELGVPFVILSVILLIFVAIKEFIKFFKEKNKKVKLNRLTIVILCGVIFTYGDLTGIALQLTNEVYSFVPTFMLLFILLYRDCIEEV